MNSSSVTRRAVLFTMLIILAGFVPLGAPMRASSTMPQCRFDPDGYFFIKGDSPRGFEDLEYIQLHVTNKRGGGPNLESYLSAKKGKSYRFAKLGGFRTHSSGSGITFEFTTEILKGVNYEFSGKFRSICVLADTVDDPEQVVAAGQLLKFKNGQKKATADVELTYSNSPRRQTSAQSNQSNDGSEAVAGTGRDVLAIVSKMELKAYTDNLSDGSVLVSDIVRFDVVEPRELTHVAVTAYYRGGPNVEGKRLQVGDLVRFELPSAVQRHGILLADIKGLRFR